MDERVHIQKKTKKREVHKRLMNDNPHGSFNSRLINIYHRKTIGIFFDAIVSRCFVDPPRKDEGLEGFRMLWNGMCFVHINWEVGEEVRGGATGKCLRSWTILSKDTTMKSVKIALKGLSTQHGSFWTNQLYIDHSVLLALLIVPPPPPPLPPPPSRVLFFLIHSF